MPLRVRGQARVPARALVPVREPVQAREPEREPLVWAVPEAGGLAAQTADPNPASQV